MKKSPHPISAECPKCGSNAYQEVDPDWQPAIVKDRICKQCSTRYSPIPPAWTPWAMLALGLLLVVAGCGFLVHEFVQKDPAAWVNPGLSALMILFGGTAIWLGAKMILSGKR